ncbi:DsbA family oxidoreductase [Actinocorallia populi]|uniref:DsbA family oxidoreductase n=1 Tax=Actinocorallia populi TaxID=2079200 RepID=UPI000D087D14|nr:DsbA family oxidoreductase [Actinocorallia populi]
MRIEIWADVVCPWAYIGKRRLERAPLGEDVEVVWRPYRVDPAAPARAVPLEEALEEVLQDPAAGESLAACSPGLAPQDNRARVARIAADEGLGPVWGAAWRADSHGAHRLIALAYAEGGAELQDAVVEGVLRAHFVEALDISAPDVLEGVAREAGFADGARLLAGGAGEDLVRELVLTGKAMGVRTSPTFVVRGRALAGAQSPEAIAEFVRYAAGQEVRGLPEEVERLRHAESLLEQRDPLGALVLLRPLLESHGEDRGVRMLAARAYFASAQLGRATRELEGLVSEAPDDSYARLLLGRTLRRRGLEGEAAVHLSLAAVMSPHYAG